MKAEIKTYRTNAHLWTDDPDTQGFDVNYDFQDSEYFDDEKEQSEWIEEVLEPIKGCDNYKDIVCALTIATECYVAD